MAFVILEPCQNEKAGECVTVCPVDAIVEEFDLTPNQEIYLEKAEEFYGK